MRTIRLHGVLVDAGSIGDGESFVFGAMEIFELVTDVVSQLACLDSVYDIADALVGNTDTLFLQYSRYLTRRLLLLQDDLFDSPSPFRSKASIPYRVLAT